MRKRQDMESQKVSSAEASLPLMCFSIGIKIEEGSKLAHDRLWMNERSTDETLNDRSKIADSFIITSIWFECTSTSVFCIWVYKRCIELVAKSFQTSLCCPQPLLIPHWGVMCWPGQRSESEAGQPLLYLWGMWGGISNPDYVSLQATFQFK